MASTVSRFRRLFWQPPRAHGDIIEDRSVSFLELFYDLVYVVVIAQAAHHLAEHVSWRGALDFVVVFSLIWIAWINGTTYHDLHGRADGRTRTTTFLQMGILAVLAVFTSGATGADGAAFAVVYTLYLIVLTWLWYTVRRVDEDDRYEVVTRRFLIGMLVSIVVMTVSVFLPPDARVALWGVFVVGTLVGQAILDRVPRGLSDVTDGIGDSLIERFGLFTIIVLGEVIVGVVTGMSDSERSGIVIVTGILALTIGFAYWWTYFDFVGGRRVKHARGSMSTWMIGHLPVTGGIAASGAAMVGLIEHASDARTPESTAWLLTGAIAVGLVALIPVMRMLVDYERIAAVYRPVSIALAVAAGIALAIGLFRPSPWLLALLIYLLLSAVWGFAILLWVKKTDGDTDIPALG